MAEKKTPPFYMVYVDGERFPQFKHSAQQDAETEAKRLADLTRKEVFILCPSTSFKTIGKYETTEYSTDDLPF